MAIATISVNFATAAEVISSGTLTAVKSINPAVLRSALQSGSSFGWTPNINGLLLQGSLGIRNTNALRALHVGTGITAPVTATTNAILVNTTGAGQVAAFVARNDTNTVESSLGVNSTVGYVGTNSNHTLQLWTNNAPRVHIDVNGNVGIGAAASGALLHLTAATADIRLQGTNRTFEIVANNAVDASGALTVQDITAGVARIFINSSGNIGINTTTPGAVRLYVNGSSTVDGAFIGLSTGAFSGRLSTSAAIASTNTTTGSLVVTGGAGISGATYVGGLLNVAGTGTVGGVLTLTANVFSSNTSTGSLVVTGGIGASGAINIGSSFAAGGTGSFGGIVTLTSGVASSSTTTGALVVTGGIGASGSIYSGGSVNATGTGSFASITGTSLNIGSGTVTCGVVNASSSITGASLSVGAGTVTCGNVNSSGTIQATGDIIAYSGSDIRLKDNITPIDDPIGKLLQISGVKYDWKPESGYEGVDYGVIAQEIEKVLPEVVATRPGPEGYKAVRYEKIIPLLIEAIKVLASKNNCNKCK